MPKDKKIMEPKEPKGKYPPGPPAAIKPKKTAKSRGRQFRRDGMGFSESDKNQPEWKRFHELEEGTTLEAFIADADMAENPKAAHGAIRAGRYSVGKAEQRGDGWVLERPIECTRVTNPKFVLRPPCVIRGGWKQQKVAIITGVKRV